MVERPVTGETRPSTTQTSPSGVDSTRGTRSLRRVGASRCQRSGGGFTWESAETIRSCMVPSCEVSVDGKLIDLAGVAAKDARLIGGGELAEDASQRAHGAGIHRVGVRVIRRPQHAVGADEARDRGQRLLVRVEGDPALPAEVVARIQLEAALVVEDLAMVVHPLEPVRDPAPTRLEEEEPEAGEALAHAAHDEAAEGQHLVEGVADHLRDVDLARRIG